MNLAHEDPLKHKNLLVRVFALIIAITGVLGTLGSTPALAQDNVATLASLTINNENPQGGSGLDSAGSSVESSTDLGSVSLESLSNVNISATPTEAISGVEYEISSNESLSVFSGTGLTDGSGDSGNGPFTGTVDSIANGQYLFIQVTAKNNTDKGYYRVTVNQKKPQLSNVTTLTALTINGEGPRGGSGLDPAGSDVENPTDLGSVSIENLSNVAISATPTEAVSGVEYQVSSSGSETSFKGTGLSDTGGNGAGPFTGDVASITSGQYLLIEVTAKDNTNKGYYKVQVNQKEAQLSNVTTLKVLTIGGETPSGGTGSLSVAGTTVQEAADLGSVSLQKLTQVTISASTSEAVSGIQYQIGDTGSESEFSGQPLSGSETGPYTVDVASITSGQYLFIEVTAGNGNNKGYYKVQVTQAATTPTPTITEVDPESIPFDYDGTQGQWFFEPASDDVTISTTGVKSASEISVTYDNDYAGLFDANSLKVTGEDNSYSFTVKPVGNWGKDFPNPIALKVSVGNSTKTVLVSFTEQSANITSVASGTWTATPDTSANKNGQSLANAIPITFTVDGNANLASIGSVALTVDSGANVSYVASSGPLAQYTGQKNVNNVNGKATIPGPLNFNANPYLYVKVTGLNSSIFNYYLIQFKQIAVKPGESSVEVGNLPSNAGAIKDKIESTTAIAGKSESAVNDAIMEAVAGNQALVSKLENKQGLVQQLASAGVSGANVNNVNCYYMPTLSITVAQGGYDPGESLTLNITPVYSVVASTAASASGVNVGASGNAVVISEAKPYPLGNVNVSIPVPAGIGVEGATVYARHASDPWYKRTVSDGAVTLFVTSFSPFTVQRDEPGVASIGSGANTVYYDTVQDAINALNPEAPSPQTITLTDAATQADLNGLIPPTNVDNNFTFNITAPEGSEVDVNKATFWNTQVGASMYSASISDGTVTVAVTTIPDGVQIARLTLSDRTVNVTAGKTVTLTATSAGFTAPNGLVATSSDTSVATVEVTGTSVAVTGLEAGTATITVTAPQATLEDGYIVSSEGLTATCAVTVTSQSGDTPGDNPGGGTNPAPEQTAREKLQAAVAAALTTPGTENGGRYTEASWASYASALASAQAVLADTDATEAELTDATTALADAIAALVEVQVQPVPVPNVPMYRLYNPYDHLHIYTSDPVEVEALKTAGWVADFSGDPLWYAPGSDADGAFTVIRFYNRWSGDHYYCPQSDEEQIAQLERDGWTQDSSASWFFSAAKDSDIPVYQLFNPFNEVDTHLWTVNEVELDTLVRPDGWELNQTVIWAASLTAE